MRYRLSFFLFLVFIFAGCAAQNREKAVKEHSSDNKLQIGLVFDVGGRGDKSFNDSAYNGLEIAKKKFGTNFLYVEPQGEGADREAALLQMATDPDVGLVIGVGLLFSEDITRIAAEFPDKKFVCIDYISQPKISIPANLQGIVFEEKKGSYLAAAIPTNKASGRGTSAWIAKAVPYAPSPNNAAWARLICPRYPTVASRPMRSTA